MGSCGSGSKIGTQNGTLASGHMEKKSGVFFLGGGFPWAVSPPSSHPKPTQAPESQKASAVVPGLIVHLLVVDLGNVPAVCPSLDSGGWWGVDGMAKILHQLVQPAVYPSPMANIGQNSVVGMDETR